MVSFSYNHNVSHGLSLPFSTLENIDQNQNIELEIVQRHRFAYILIKKELISGGGATCKHGNHLSSDFRPLGLRGVDLFGAEEMSGDGHTAFRQGWRG
jgi:hypothetical protein